MVIARLGEQMKGQVTHGEACKLRTWLTRGSLAIEGRTPRKEPGLPTEEGLCTSEQQREPCTWSRENEVSLTSLYRCCCRVKSTLTGKPDVLGANAHAFDLHLYQRIRVAARGRFEGHPVQSTPRTQSLVVLSMGGAHVFQKENCGMSEDWISGNRLREHKSPALQDACLGAKWPRACGGLD